MNPNAYRTFLICFVGIRLGAAVVIPSDSGFKHQVQHNIQNSFGLPDEIGLLHTPEAWSVTTGSPSVRVAVVSTGIDDRLLDLAGRLVPGYNFVSNDTNTMDIQGTGTTMATLLGANANNPNPNNPSGPALGTVGVDWHCEIMPIKVMESGHVPSKESCFAQGINYATENGCKVILVGPNSGVSGGELAPDLISSAISNSVSRGSIVVTAGGRWSGSAAKHPLAITVGAAGLLANPSGPHTFRHADFSDSGPELDFVALADPVYCTGLSASNGIGHTDFRQGTDLAAAQVAGVCSLMAAVRPNITWREAYALLAAGADDRGIAPQNKPGWDQYLGWGLVNAYISVQLAALKINSVRKVADNQVELFWSSPSDAIDRNYFRVDFTPNLNKPWVEMATGSFFYQRDHTLWTGPFQFGFYRIRVALGAMPN